MQKNSLEARSKMTNFSSLKMQAELALSKLEGKRYIVSDLNARLQKAAAENPQDTVINAVARVVEQVCSKNPEKIVSQGEVEQLYNELVGLNVTGTKFREVLGDLLLSERTLAQPDEEYIRGRRDEPGQGEIDYDADPAVREGLDVLFTPQSDRYDPQCASEAKEKVGLELRSLGFDNARIRLAGGDSRFLVFAADLDTNRGSVRIFVPADASGKQLPSVFIAGHTFKELSIPTLNEYLADAAYRNNRLPSVKAILGSLNALTGNVKNTMPTDDFNKVASNLPELNGSEGLSSPGVFASLPDENKNIGEVTIPQTPTPEPLKALASEIEENVLEASVGYPLAAVRLTKRMLIAELGSMGFKGAQIRVASSTTDGFICEATINTPKGKTTVEIPIEMSGQAPLLPTVFAKDDYVAEFTAVNLQDFAKSDMGESTISRYDSNMNGMTLAQLKDVIVKAAIDEDLNTCDEAIEVIGNRFEPEVFRNVVADYHQLLISLETTKDNAKAAHDDSDQFVQTPNSIYPVHKKLGRPAHDLVRDENGVYHLKSTYSSRKNQEVSGALFNTAKVLVGDE
jgi:hypothetical protein